MVCLEKRNGFRWRSALFHNLYLGIWITDLINLNLNSKLAFYVIKHTDFYSIKSNETI